MKHAPVVVSLVLVVVFAAAARAPAEEATKSEMLDVIEASLAAGEGIPAQVILARYLEHHPKTPKVAQLEILTNYFVGNYEEAAQGVIELRENRRAPTELGSLADVIVDTYETTKDYETFRYEGFEVRYSPGEDELLVPYAVDTLKAAADALEAELGVKMVSPVRLEIYPDAESLARVSTLSVDAIRTTGTIALCKWGRLMIASPRALMRGYPWLDTIAHEYVHLLLTKATLDRAPVWLQEGIAKFLETRWREGEPKLPYDPASRKLLRESAAAGALLDFDQLHPSIALLPSQRDAALAFAQVSSFVEMFYRGYGSQGLQALLDRVGDGEDARSALAQVARVPWRELEKQWQASVLEGPDAPAARLLPRHLSDEATEQDEIADVELSKARRYLRLGDMLWARSRPAAASVEYGKAHESSPGDPIVASRYARAALAGGRPKAAIAPLMRTLERYPNHAPALSALATAFFRTRAHDLATEVAYRAIAHNPFDPQPHCVLAHLAVPQAEHEATVCDRLGGLRE